MKLQKKQKKLNKRLRVLKIARKNTADKQKALLEARKEAEISKEIAERLTKHLKDFDEIVAAEEKAFRDMMDAEEKAFFYKMNA